MQPIQEKGRPCRSPVHSVLNTGAEIARESDSPEASSSRIVLTSFLTLPLLEGPWQDQGAAELQNAQDLCVREEPGGPA